MRELEKSSVTQLKSLRKHCRVPAKILLCRTATRRDIFEMESNEF
jgi:hypothetical protein